LVAWLVENWVSNKVELMDVQTVVLTAGLKEFRQAALLVALTVHMMAAVMDAVKAVSMAE
jgi:hypothetical protein